MYADCGRREDELIVLNSIKKSSNAKVARIVYVSDKPLSEDDVHNTYGCDILITPFVPRDIEDILVNMVLQIIKLRESQDIPNVELKSHPVISPLIASSADTSVVPRVTMQTPQFTDITDITDILRKFPDHKIEINFGTHELIATTVIKL